MTPSSLDAIRDAVNSEDYPLAQALWNECAAALASELSERRLSADQLSEVREFVEWSRMTVISARAHMRDELNALHVAEGYQVHALFAPSHDLVDSSF